MSDTEKTSKYNKKLKILKMKDSSDKSVIKHPIFNVPLRLAIVGGSGTGKTNILSNLIIDPLKGFYHDIWLPENIYIFSGSYKTDNKLQALVKCLGIEQSNIFLDYDDDIVNTIYDDIEERVEALNKKEKMFHSLFIFDDLSFSHSIRSKRNNALGRLYLNGRKNQISSIFIAQTYTQIPKPIRMSNLTGLILYNMPTRELEEVEKEHNFMGNKKMFMEKFKEAVGEERHDFFVISYSRKLNDMYMNKNFNVIKH
jgi:hypothetical protein